MSSYNNPELYCWDECCGAVDSDLPPTLFWSIMPCWLSSHLGPHWLYSLCLPSWYQSSSSPWPLTPNWPMWADIPTSPDDIPTSPTCQQEVAAEAKLHIWLNSQLLSKGLFHLPFSLYSSGNDILLYFHCWQYDPFKLLHRSRQHSCRDMCKSLVEYVCYFLHESKKHLWDLSAKSLVTCPPGWQWSGLRATICCVSR